MKRNKERDKNFSRKVYLMKPTNLFISLKFTIIEQIVQPVDVKILISTEESIC